MISENNKLEMINYATQLVLESGNILKQAIEGNIECDYKEDQRDLVTEYDLKIENFLLANLKLKYPKHKFISEEKINDEEMSGLIWIIDPIDGTTNFVCFKKNFAVSIALYEDENPVFGIVYDVMKDDFYLGITGKGAYLNGKRLNNLGQTSLKDCILDVSLNSMQIFYNEYNKLFFNIARDIRGHRSLGSASLSICKIASGEIQIYVSAKLKVWDFAAAGIILKECGGYYGTLDKRCLCLTGKPVAFLACSSYNLFDEIFNLYNNSSRLYL
ncbi:MAG: inositol monophosphatase family protein [Sedimentibacter sp.]